MKRFVGCFYHRWLRNEISLRAAALTYYAVFSVFPLVLLLTSGIGWLLQDPARQRAVVHAVLSLLPQGSDTLTHVVREVALTHHVANYSAAVGLLWSASGFLYGLLTAVSVIHDGRVRRSGLFLRAWSLLLIGLIITAALLSMAVLTLATRWLPLLPFGQTTRPALHLLSRQLVVLSVATLAFYLLFRLIPTRRNGRGKTFLSAALSALVWQAINLGFSAYLAHNLPRLNLIYGSLAAAIALMFYLYLVNLTLLGGAQLNAVLRDLTTCEAPPLPWRQPGGRKPPARDAAAQSSDEGSTNCT